LWYQKLPISAIKDGHINGILVWFMVGTKKQFGFLTIWSTLFVHVCSCSWIPIFNLFGLVLV